MQKLKQTPYGKKGNQFKDLVGQKFGMLTVNKFISTTKNGLNWLLMCDCGNAVIRFSGNFKRKQHKHSCGCVSKNPGKPDAGFRRLFNDYKASARNRGYSFELDKQQFKNLINMNCYYCNSPPTARYKKQVVHTLLANGIDRVNNEIGYIESNCVPCCKTCNMAKQKMTTSEFKQWIQNVFNNLELNNGK